MQNSQGINSSISLDMWPFIMVLLSNLMTPFTYPLASVFSCAGVGEVVGGGLVALLLMKAFSHGVGLLM